MVETGALFEVRGMPRTTYSTVATDSVSDLAQICQVDRVSFASFATAMEIYGFSNRIPKTYFMQTLSQKDWSVESKSRMQRDLSDGLTEYGNNEMPPLTRSNPAKIRSSNIQWIRSQNALGGWRWIDDRSVRVSTVGRLFLDMMQRPELCGGIRHVIEVFSDYAAQYLPAILAEYEAHANNIDKVRAGYILEEHCALRSDVIQQWTSFATRGGGQKLDVSSDYAPTFSERWMLSINVQ